MIGLNYLSRLTTAQHPLPGAVAGFLPSGLPGMAMGLQTELLQNPLGLNVYPYVLNNPLRYTDPTGRGVVDIIFNAAGQYLGGYIGIGSFTTAIGIVIYPYNPLLGGSLVGLGVALDIKGLMDIIGATEEFSNWLRELLQEEGFPLSGNRKCHS